MACVVTGAAGFLGSHVVDALVGRGESVFAIDNLSTGKLSNLEWALSTGRATFAFGDVGDESAEWVSDIPIKRSDKISAIYHFADTDNIKTLGTRACIAFAIACSVPLIAVHSCQGVSHHGETDIARAVRERGLTARLFRLYDCYGPRMIDAGNHVVPAMITAALEGRPVPIIGDAGQKRSLLYISDAVELIAGPLSLSESDVGPFDVASASEWETVKIAQMVVQVVGVNTGLEYVSPSVCNARSAAGRRPDLARAHALGWRDRTPLEAGLALTTDWYRENRLAYV